MISIIIPYHNVAKTFGQAIISLLDQTNQNFELLLIDNNSTDQSKDIAIKFASKDLRIKLLSETQQGVVFAANTGMRAAKGEFIARMDADDVAHPERLKRQLNHLNSNPDIAISAAQVNYKTNNHELSDFSHFVKWSNNLTSWNDIYQNRFVEFPVVNPTLMFRRSLLEEVGYLKEGGFPEDYEWFLRVIDKGFKVEKLPLPLLDWHDSSSRLTRTDPRYQSDAFFRIKTEYLTKHLKNINQTKVWIWGAGNLGLKRSQLLLNHGIEILGYIDIKKGKQLNGFSCVHFEDIQIETQPFIISYITNRNKRDEVRSFLASKGYQEGKNYIIAG
ncbi:glycosyltransferase [Reichenbachiella sp.]